jgi:hypothetical protein
MTSVLSVTWMDLIRYWYDQLIGRIETIQDAIDAGAATTPSIEQRKQEVFAIYMAVFHIQEIVEQAGDQALYFFVDTLVYACAETNMDAPIKGLMELRTLENHLAAGQVSPAFSVTFRDIMQNFMEQIRTHRTIIDTAGHPDSLTSSAWQEHVDAVRWLAIGVEHVRDVFVLYGDQARASAFALLATAAREASMGSTPAGVNALATLHGLLMEADGLPAG